MPYDPVMAVPERKREKYMPKTAYYMGICCRFLKKVNVHKCP